MDTHENIIEFANISKKFGAVQALNDVSFSIKRGECHAIVGENGAGKSTLMNILSGVLQPDSGQVNYNGNCVKITNPMVSAELGISHRVSRAEVVPQFIGRRKHLFGEDPANEIWNDSNFRDEGRSIARS